MPQAGTYSVSGTGVELEAGSTNVAPDATTTQNNTINGVTSTWTGLDLSTQTNQTSCRHTQEQRSNSRNTTVALSFRRTQ